ncbi:MAG: polyprenyl synthetase family protein [Pyrinomonadaceae bacterium]|nr:polyprenyl synthetase family protein [Pyrinomonadaceae bacterium]MBP6211674.1 polyprenyl synthetase family protein [Pyrinomonadaceae bacterium]
MEIDLDKYLADCRQLVEAELEKLVPRPEVEPVRLHEAIRWSLFAGGKRFRPAVLMAVGSSFGASFDLLVRSAAAIEMIHTFSLIHDDLPAMDDDDLRRGRKTCHKQFGEATAILAGDVLQTLAFKALADDNGLSPETRVRIISMIASASGTPMGMVAGQQLDLEAEGLQITIDELDTIHTRKTGALITVSAMVGAVIGGASEAEIDLIREYSAKLGLLFQITDDLIDVTESTETLGKTAGKDLNAQKATYPGKFGIETTREIAMSVRDQAFVIADQISTDTTVLKALVDRILNRTS